MKKIITYFLRKYNLILLPASEVETFIADYKKTKKSGVIKNIIIAALMLAVLFLCYLLYKSNNPKENVTN